MSIFGSKLEHKNVRWGGLQSPGPWMLLVGLLAGGLLLFNLSPRGLVLVTAVGVVGVVVAGFVSSNESSPARSRRRLAKAQLQSARQQVAAKPPSPTKTELRQAKAAMETLPARPNREARPSRSWQQRQGTSQALLLGLFAAWASTTGLALSALHGSLGPRWDRVTKGLSGGTWLVILLFGISFVAFVPVASWIESRVTQAQRRRHDARG